MTQQKTVLVTGCSDGGIGAALAAEFARKGCRVFAAARNLDKMETLAEEQYSPGSITPLQLDVTSDSSIATCVAVVGDALSSSIVGEEGAGQAERGGLDILVNNAGVNHVMPFADDSVADLRRVIETNVVGVFAVTHGFLPLLLQAAKKSKGRGAGSVVATVGSINEIYYPPFQVAYNASKAAVHAMANTLRNELAPLGVRFVTLVTGAVRTHLFDNAPSSLPAGSAYTPIKEEIEGRAFLNSASFVTPEAYARQVVRELLRDQPRRTVWAGGFATVSWILSWLGWEGMLVGLTNIQALTLRDGMVMNRETLTGSYRTVLLSRTAT